MKVFLFCLLASSIFATERDSFTVYYFLQEDCKICQYYSPTFDSLYQKYNSDSIGFLGLFPNSFSSKENIEKFKSKYQIPFPLKKEYFQTKTKLFDATITPEVVVFNESTKQVVYKGRIDNSYYKLGRRRQVITERELEFVLEAIQKGETIEAFSQPAIGCYIKRD